MREIILDTETTGFDPLKGDRIVEIGCVELMNHIPTGKIYHAYINPERAVPTAASAVHGLTDEFLADKPAFAEIVSDFLEFIGDDAPLVIHNASFDMGFLNAELVRHGFKMLPFERAIDTLAIARKKYPGAPASLDALCKRFGVNLSERNLHGALLDSRLLAEVYLELRGGRQPDLAISVVASETEVVIDTRQREYRAARDHKASADEIEAHEKFLEDIREPLWKRA